MFDESYLHIDRPPAPYLEGARRRNPSPSCRVDSAKEIELCLDEQTCSRFVTGSFAGGSTFIVDDKSCVNAKADDGDCVNVDVGTNEDKDVLGTSACLHNVGKASAHDKVGSNEYVFVGSLFGDSLFEDYERPPVADIRERDVMQRFDQDILSSDNVKANDKAFGEMKGTSYKSDCYQKAGKTSAMKADKVINVDYLFIGNLFGDDIFGDMEPPVDNGLPPSDVKEDDKEPEPGESKSIQQARRIAEQAATLWEDISAEIETANRDLETMNHPRTVVPKDSIELLQTVLNNDMNVLIGQMETQEAHIGDLNEEIGDLRSELQVATDKVTELEENSSGLSKTVKARLNIAGVQNVNELVDKYMILQGRVGILQKSLEAKSKTASVLSRASSIASLPKEEYIKKEPRRVEQGGSTSLNVNKGGIPKVRVQLPMPEKFSGKTRTELARFFKLYDAGTDSQGWGDKEKAIYLGSYLSNLQLYHDCLMQKGVSYAVMKEELLNSLGSDGAIATFHLRSKLDRLTKVPGKSYMKMFEEIELQVAEAYGSDATCRENELKKILLRITEEDANPIYRTIVLTNVNESYYKLKELVLGIESSPGFKPKVDKPSFTRKPFSPNDNGNFKGNGGTYKPTSESGDQQRVESYARRPLTCYRCNKEGHHSRDCIEHKDASTNFVKLKDLMLGNVQATESKVGQNNPLFGKQALLDVSFDGVTVKTLIDSGAQASVIKDTVVGNILRLKNETGCKIVEVARNVYEGKRLVGADGSLLKVVNCINVPVAFGTVPNQFASLFVVQGLHQDAIIGTNVLQNDVRWMEAISTALGVKSGVNKGVNALKSSDCFSRESVAINKVESLGLETKVKEPEGQKLRVMDKREVINDMFCRDDDKSLLSLAEWFSHHEGSQSVERKTDADKLNKKVYCKPEAENKSYGKDTVIIGGRNANKLARAIGAIHWSSNVLKDVDFLSNINGKTVKKVIFLPSGDIFFHRGLDYGAALNMLWSSIQQLSKLDAVKVIVLPVFRNCSSLNVSNKISAWYKKTAEMDARFIGCQTVNGMNLYEWMEAIISVESSRQYVNEQGIITEDGVKRLREYMNALDYDLKVLDSVKRKNFDPVCRSMPPKTKHLVRGQNESACENDLNKPSSYVKFKRDYRQPFKPRPNNQIRQNTKFRPHQNASDCQNGSSLPYHRGRNSDSRVSNRHAPYNQNRGQRNFRGRKI